MPFDALIAPKLLTKSELADAMGVSVRTIEGWQTQGKIVPDWRTPGGSPRFWWPPLSALPKESGDAQP